jgi:hypothetical protein
MKLNIEMLIDLKSIFRFTKGICTSSNQNSSFNHGSYTIPFLRHISINWLQKLDGKLRSTSVEKFTQVQKSTQPPLYIFYNISNTKDNLG